MSEKSSGYFESPRADFARMKDANDADHSESAKAQDYTGLSSKMEIHRMCLRAGLRAVFEREKWSTF